MYNSKGNMIIEEKIKDYKVLISSFSKVLFNNLRESNNTEVNSSFFERIYSELDNISTTYKGTDLEEISRNMFLTIYNEIARISKK